MAGLDLTTAAGILKEFYLPAVREQINNKIPFLQQLEKNTEDVEGSEAVISLHLSRSAGVGARLEGGTLPTAGNQGYTKQRVPLRTQTARGKVSIQAIKALATNRSSFERAVDSEMTRLQNDAKRDVNRQLFGTSDGVIATLAVSTSSTTVNLAASTTPAQLRQLEKDMVIDIGTVASPTATASARTISSINRAAKTLVISGAAISGATTDRIFRQGSGGAIGGIGQAELTGLPTIVDSTGTLYSVNPSTYDSWSSYEDANGGTARSVSENLFETAMDEIEIAGGTEINLWVTTHGVRRAYGNLLSALKRSPGTIDLKGGYKALDVTAGGRTAGMMVDRDCPQQIVSSTTCGSAFAVNTDHLQKHEEADWGFMDEDGAILSRVPNELAYEFTLYSIFEQTTDKRNAHGRLDNITEA